MSKRSRSLSPHAVHVRYLPGYVEGGPWQMAVINCGNEVVPAGYEEYPCREDEAIHPSGYFYTWDKGRVLNDYQILIVTEGRGVIETRSAGRLRIRKGDAFILFPGEWHRYRPDIKSGWTVSWIGLKGDHALRLMNSFFSPEHPVFAVKDSVRILGGYQEIEKLVNRDPERFAGRIAALVTGLIDEIRIAAKTWRATAREELLNRAKLTLLARSQEEVDLVAMAKDLGLSYSSFRRAFRASTGQPPRQYLLAIRINRAKVLLQEGGRKIGAIAAEVGFSSVHYFSRYFREATGMTPLEYRKRSATAGMALRHGDSDILTREEIG